MKIILLLTSAFILTLFHTILPEHWMPFVLVGKAQKWNTRKTLFVATAAATGHVLITLLLGFIVSFISTNTLTYVGEFSKIIPSIILIIIGLLYLLPGLRNAHSHSHTPVISDKTTIFSLIAMFSFSPCEAVLPLFVLLHEMGLVALGILSIIILASTILGMILLITLTLYGYNKIHLHWLEDNEKTFIGSVLLLLGILAFVF